MRITMPALLLGRKLDLRETDRRDVDSFEKKLLRDK
jgi:hypothetical protein